MQGKRAAGVEVANAGEESSWCGGGQCMGREQLVWRWPMQGKRAACVEVPMHGERAAGVEVANAWGESSSCGGGQCRGREQLVWRWPMQGERAALACQEGYRQRYISFSGVATFV